MDSGAKIGKQNYRLSSMEHKDVESAAAYASDHVKDMEDLIQKFQEMGCLGLFWDGKVPEKNKSFFNFISFESSNKVTVIEETEKYLDFFKAVLTGMKKLNGDMQMSESEECDPLSIVDILQYLLCDMDKAAKSGLTATDSSALYRKHSEFIEKFSQLESKMNRVACIFSREKIRILFERLNDSQKTLEGFKVCVKEFQNSERSMTQQIAELVAENERQRQHQQSLVAQNANLIEDQKNLLGEYDRVCNRLESIESLLINISQKNKNNIEKE